MKEKARATSDRKSVAPIMQFHIGTMDRRKEDEMEMRKQLQSGKMSWKREGTETRGDRHISRMRVHRTDGKEEMNSTINRFAMHIRTIVLKVEFIVSKEDSSDDIS